jgi:hypothetical protein
MADVEKAAEKTPIRDQIMNLETFMKAMPAQEQVELPVYHHFSKGVYARELRIPKGHVVVGKIHKYQNLNILAQGDITVVTEDGPLRIKAPAVVVSPPGVKRVGYAHEDTVWICVHATEQTDLDAIEEEVIAKTYDEVPELQAKAAPEISDGEQP